MKRALLIEWDPNTGERAGGIDPRDPKLRCYGWQNMEVAPALELRLVEDDRDLTVYEGMEGVTVLEGEKAINEAIRANFPPRYVIGDQALYAEHLRRRKDVNLDTLPDDRNERLKVLRAKGIKGIREVKPAEI